MNEKDRTLKTKEKNSKRAKEALTTFGDIAIQGGAAAAGVPGLGAAYKIILALYAQAKTYYKNRQDDRIESFHHQVLTGVPEEQREEFLKAEFSVEDYCSILEKAVQDEEANKIEIYAKIFRCLIMGLIPETYKLHLIKAARQLNFSDFDFMRQLYISDKYEFIGAGNKVQQVLSLISPTDPMRAYSVQTLIRLGFLNERTAEKPPWPNDLLKIVVELLYDGESLTAGSLGKKVKTAQTEMIKVFFAYKHISDKSGNLLVKIDNQLGKEHIKTIIAYPSKKSFPLIIVPMVAICIGPEGSPIDELRTFVDFSSKTIVQILLPGADPGNVPLKDVETFDLATNETDEGERLVKYVVEKFSH